MVVLGGLLYIHRVTSGQYSSWIFWQTSSGTKNSVQVATRYTILLLYDPSSLISQFLANVLRASEPLFIICKANKSCIFIKFEVRSTLQIYIFATLWYTDLKLKFFFYYFVCFETKYMTRNSMES